MMLSKVWEKGRKEYHYVFKAAAMTSFPSSHRVSLGTQLGPACMT